MTQFTRLCINTLIATLLTGCYAHKSKTPDNADAGMIGMTKKEIRQCMGPTHSVQKNGDKDTWIYYSKGEHPTKPSEKQTTTYCEVDITFANDAVTEVTYPGKSNDFFSQGKHCAYAVRNCVKS